MNTFDEEPTEHSVALLTSGSVFTALTGKQDKRDVDEQVTQASENLITSGAVYTAVQEAVQTIQNTATENINQEEIQPGTLKYDFTLQEIRYYNGLHWVDYAPVSPDVLSALTWQQKGSDIIGLNAGTWIIFPWSSYLDGGDQHGTSISLSKDGKTIAIGAPLKDQDGTNDISDNRGQVRVFSFNESSETWLQLGNEINGDAPFNRLGQSVALSSDGRTLAVGTPFSDFNNLTSSGHVRVYYFNESDWQPLGDVINGINQLDAFGNSVALSDNGKIVAAASRSGLSNGYVRVLMLDETVNEWKQLGINLIGEANSDQSGYSIALSSDGLVVAIGAPYNSGKASSAGHVRVYTFNGTSWNQLGNDIDGESGLNESGCSVSLSADGKTVAIGAHFNNGVNGSFSGHVRVYTFDETNWNQLGEDIDGFSAGDESGFSVALSSDGRTVVIGAPYRDDTEKTNCGSFRVLRFSEGSWINQIGQEVFGKVASEVFGHAVAVSADGYTVAASSRIAQDNRGVVRVYSVLYYR